MRFLVSPVYMSLARLNASSSYTHISNLIRVLVERGHYVYWHLPDRDDYIPDPLESNPRVKVIRTPMYVDQYIEGVQMRGMDEMFSRNHGKYVVDGIITSRTCAIPLWKLIVETPSLRHKRNPTPDGKLYIGHAPPMPFFVIDLFPKKQYRANTAEVNPLEYVNQALGYSLSDKVFMAGITDYEDILPELRKHLPASRLKELITHKLKVIPFGVNIDKIKRWREQHPDVRRDDPRKLLKIIFIGRILSSNGAVEVLDQADYLYRLGNAVDFKVPTSALRENLPPPMAKKLAQVTDHVPILAGTPQDQFFAYLHSAHVGVTPANYRHNFPTAILEAIYSGVGVIVKKENWITYYIGDDYPLYYDGSHAQLLALVRWAQENWPEVEARLEKYRLKIEQTLDAKICMNRIVDEIEASVKEAYRRSHKNSGFREVLATIPESKQEITLKEAMDYIYKHSDTKIRIGQVMTTGWMKTKGALDYALKANGWVDTCEDEFPVYRRGGEVEPFLNDDETEAETEVETEVETETEPEPQADLDTET